MSGNLDSEGDPVTVSGAFALVPSERGMPCQLVTKGEFVESVGVSGNASVPSRRFSKSLRDEYGRDVRTMDVVKLTTRGGEIAWYLVKGTPEKHPNDGSRRLNWQAYDLAPTVPLNL